MRRTRRTGRLAVLMGAAAPPYRRCACGRRPTARAMCSNQPKESVMDEDLDLIDLGDAKEATKGWGAPEPREEEPSLPFRE